MESSLKYFVKNRHATWLELYFDLVFVAAIGFITHSLAHTHDNHLSVSQIVKFPLYFIPIWWIWASHTMYSNLFDTDSRHHRLATLAIMFLFVLIPPLLKGDGPSHYLYFACVYMSIRLIIGFLYLSSQNKHKDGAYLAKVTGTAFIIGALISGSSLFFDEPLRYFVLYAGIAFDLLYPLFKKIESDKLPTHLEHLVERTGLLILILQGEAMISLVSALQDVVWTPLSMCAALCGFIMTGAIWWIYFDSFHKLERANRTLTGNSILYSHLLLCMGLVLLANVIRHAILQDLANPYFSLLAITGMCLFYLGKQIPYYILFPILRSYIIINSVVCVAITVASTFLPRTEYSLVGMTLAMVIYSMFNLYWVLPKDTSAYLKH